MARLAVAARQNTNGRLKKKYVQPKTPAQRDYYDSITRNNVTLAIGPAGTGKTYLAVAQALNALEHGDVKRIILSRPAVEAGERLGFLPGTLDEKVDPYLRPLTDAMKDIIDSEQFAEYMALEQIEVAPLAFMRGRSFNDSFLILDEGQNTTFEQMKMFLTRFGYGSKMVVTGDVTQIDLPKGTRNGLLAAQEILNGVDGAQVVQLTSKDVVRHPMVARIVDAYESWEHRDENAE